MVSKSLASILTFLFMLTAGVTWVAGEAGQGADGRLTMADFVAVLIIFYFLLIKMTSQRISLYLPKEYRAYIPLLLVFTLGVAFSALPARGLFELLIHFFIFLVSLALVNLHYQGSPEVTARSLLKMVLYAGSILATLGLVDFLVWQGLFPGETSGLVGTFRNTGQAGAFFGMYLVIIIPGLLSGLIRPSKLNLILVLSIILALVLTSKRAAMIGFGVGIALLVFRMVLSKSKRDKKYGFGILLISAMAIPLGYLAFQWGIENISGMEWRFEKKFNASTIEEFSEGFLAENIAVTRLAFEMNPLVGVGLGNVAGVLTAKYEIHSTYLAIIGNNGILGMLAYAMFMGTFLLNIIKTKAKNVYSLYLSYFLPFFVGLIFAWAYTYHLRKREFWILFFIVVLMRHFASRKSQTIEELK